MVPNHTIVVAFGRFNPPSTGHAKLFQRVKQEANARQADECVFVFPTEDSRNPLPFREKLSILRRLFPTTLFNAHERVRNPYQALWALARGGYEHVVIVTGDDRLAEYSFFKKLIRPATRQVTTYETVYAEDYAEDDGGQPKIVIQPVLKTAKQRDRNYINLNSLEIVPIKRDGVSATKLRDAARRGDYESFAKDTPTRNPRMAEQLFTWTRKYQESQCRHVTEKSAKTSVSPIYTKLMEKARSNRLKSRS